MLRSSRNYLLFAMLAFAGCGDDGTNGDPDSTNNGATNNNSTNNGSANNDATDDVCAEGRYTQTELFDEHEQLPFELEHPAGWMVVDTTSADVVSGSVKVAGASAFSDQYTVLRTPDSGGILAIWQQSHEVIGQVTYDGQQLDVYSLPDVAQAKLLLPFGGENYQVSMIFQGPDECMEERLALRDLFLEGFAANPETTFPD